MQGRSPAYRARHRLGPDGLWRAEVAEIPECTAIGRTFQEARTRIREALQVRVLDLDADDVVDEIQHTG